MSPADCRVIKFQIAFLSPADDEALFAYILDDDNVSLIRAKCLHNDVISFWLNDRQNLVDFFILFDILWVLLFTDLAKELFEVVFNTSLILCLFDLLLVPFDQTVEMNHPTRSRTLAGRTKKFFRSLGLRHHTVFTLGFRKVLLQTRIINFLIAVDKESHLVQSHSIIANFKILVFFEIRLHKKLAEILSMN
jgi:hypothetical protein